MVGDFNINLINSKSHSGSKNFIDLLFSLGLYPLVIKPTRISFDSATLIDNIFTNNFSENFTGILINDISNHLPIFTVLRNNLSLRRATPKTKYQRKVTDENLGNLNSDLHEYNWDSIMQLENVNEAYGMFIKNIEECFEKNCPLRRIKLKYKPDKHWLTKGLLNACKKKYCIKDPGHRTLSEIKTVQLLQI